MIVTGLVIILASAADAMLGAAIHVPGLGILLGITSVCISGGYAMLNQGLKDAEEEMMASCRASCRKL